ncbi:MAG TPA: SIMPL domain-containing protein [Nocardioides sp.]|uniref:SIMPL domain-containing protein n=1 Tax=Nocardioides sp. TaxID=35761 RepID=UPI002E36EED4|nr:SIMPL domain-containing protein [Nocardioides sp.]HEX5086683.1 SIMPL domain-containing protein [Nocardioides sp.]
MDKNVTLGVRWLLVAGLVAVGLVAAYLAGSAGGSPARAETSGSTRTITVTGVGHVSVVPDELAFDLSVSVLRPGLTQALDDANGAMQSVVDTLKAAGVADKDVQTTDVSMYPEYGRHQKGQPPTLQGYRVSHSITVTVDDLSRGSDVVTAALAAGGKGVRLDGLRLQVADPEAAIGPARSDAVQQARAKAEALAEDAGRELGDVVRISENADQPYAEDMRGAYDAAASAAGPVPIQPGQEDLTASVVVVYELG